VDGAEAVFIAVGTPTRRGDGHADLTFVMAAAEEIGRALTGYAVVVTKSTVPVGTNRKVAEAIRAAKPERPRSMSPRTRSSCARVPRSTISCVPTAWWWAWRSDRARKVMAELYRPLSCASFPMVYTDLEAPR
jgi:UDPglucose 6-dehydrogenase